jgi:plastocyanin
MRRAWLGSWILVLLLTTSRPAAGGAQDELAIRLFQFQPARLEVMAGSRLTWINTDGVAHTVTSGTSDQPDGRFHGVVAEQGGRFSLTLDRPGAYAYFCDRHHFMRGEVRVTPGKAGN